jgi:hypothetical protein
MFHYSATIARKNREVETRILVIDSCVAAGYTGRNQALVDAHINELKAMGVATPYDIPALYWISPARLTHHPQLLVVGEQTSPEVEFFLATDVDKTRYVTVASDHTDRELEAVSVGKSKQICDKILGDVFWMVDDITDHWDSIELSSRTMKDNQWVTYQKGTLGSILDIRALMNKIEADSFAGAFPAFLSGTLPIIGGEAIYTSACEISMTDPILKRSITKSYQITVLPDRS